MISYYIWFGFMLFLFGFGCGSALYLFTYLGNRKLTYLAEVEIKNAIKNCLIELEELYENESANRSWKDERK